MHPQLQELKERMQAEAHDVAALLWGDPDVALEHTRQLRDLTAQAEAIAVRIMRTDHGSSWQQIADALGVSRQAAWERFHHIDEDE